MHPDGFCVICEICEPIPANHHQSRQILAHPNHPRESACLRYLRETFSGEGDGPGTCEGDVVGDVMDVAGGGGGGKQQAPAAVAVGA